ncbi:hypothetical protein L210DRAFT_3117251 [Boletus edulis BED1]|uniref:Uncharacterized protein n=1 Tax=Boletus edulis BED1 TaxID=1328754 RepID=A0AAD4BGW3_BOLED|nr:hypothetical protein L210DRAFT_3117251 [Boletus edulis BED1]
MIASALRLTPVTSMILTQSLSSLVSPSRMKTDVRRHPPLGPRGLGDERAPKRTHMILHRNSAQHCLACRVCALAVHHTATGANPPVRFFLL